MCFHLVKCVFYLNCPRSRSSGGGRHVPPLYFQHQGHSRTIVGVEIMKSDGGGGVRLLVFDPSNSKMGNFLAGGDGMINF